MLKRTFPRAIHVRSTVWFWLDLVSSVPFDWFLEGGLDFTTTKYVGIRPGQNLTSARSDAVALAGIVKTFKIVKLLRLLRVVRLFRCARVRRTPPLLRVTHDCS